VRLLFIYVVLVVRAYCGFGFTTSIAFILIDNGEHSRQLGTSPLVTLDLPSALSPRVINALKADPRTVDLRSLAPHFYGLGARILELFEEEEMVEVLSEVLTHSFY
jgi:hypothetical protein